jgi:hypothetical protein
MITAIEYRAMALQHHRWAGMCRSPESREEHFRMEKELLARANSEERLHVVRAVAERGDQGRG